MTQPAKATLHYIYDAMCGWCYAAAPLLEAAKEISGLEVELHGGGLFSPRRITPDFREFVKPHDQRIAEISGQTFGAGYTDRLLTTDAVIDSLPPITAVLAVERCGADGGEMLAAIQKAHFITGNVVSDIAVLTTVAERLGIDSKRFKAAYEEVRGTTVEQHLANSRAKMASVGGQGYPTFILERGDQVRVLNASRYFGKTADWVRDLQL